LNETDWYYARQFETGELIPNDVKQKRIESRNRINELEQQETESADGSTNESTTNSSIADESSTTESTAESTN
jgi:hypothetical protein